MDFGFTIAAYAVAGVLFILSAWRPVGAGKRQARRLVRHRRHGCRGLATLIGPGSGLWLMSLVLIAGGAAVGYQLATRVR
jgi:NAD(P) transhydrogenase subunit beta